METKQEQRLHARNLYFATGMSQQEIADQCNISRKTLYLWMNEGGWRHAKYAGAHAPALLLDQYYEQLGKLNQHIASRENPWPTKDEATTIRKITMSINYFKETTSTKQTTQVFHDFIKYLQFKENKWEMAKEFILPIDRFVKQMMEDKNWLSYNFNTMHNEEQHFEREHEEWLKTQKQEEQPDVTLSPSKDILGSSKDEPSVEKGPNAQTIPTPTPEHNPVAQAQPGPNTQSQTRLPTGTVPNSAKMPPAKPRPLTYEEVKQKVETMDLRKKSVAQAQTQNTPDNVISSSPKNLTPNLPAGRQGSNKENDVIPSSSGGPRAITYTPGTPPKGAPRSAPNPAPAPHNPRHSKNDGDTPGGATTKQL